MGSIVLIEEDRFCNYSRVLSKYFLAEAVVKKHGIFFASLEDRPSQFLHAVPRPVKEAETTKETTDNNDMRIAFMYNQLPKVDSEIPASSNSATNYDLSTSITDKELSALDITYHEEKDHLIPSLKNVAKQEIYSKRESAQEHNLLRICINSYGSPLWYSDANFGRSLLTTLVELKAIMRNIYGVCFITIPWRLLYHFDSHLMDHIRNLVDISIEIESFAASEKETNPVFKDYHGLLHIRKLNALDTFAAFCPETLDLAFKLKRKRFVIEKLHLPPELENEESQAKLPTMGCSSSGGSSGRNNLLDF